MKINKTKCPCCKKLSLGVEISHKLKTIVCYIKCQNCLSSSYHYGYNKKANWKTILRICYRTWFLNIQKIEGGL